MTANQIMIPLAVLAVMAIQFTMMIRNNRANKKRGPRVHAPHAGGTQRDKAATA